MSNYIEYENLIAFHPGSYVYDIIEDLNISQDEFAERLGVSAKTVSKIINAKANISSDLALRLEKLTGVSYDTWVELQSSFDKKKLEIENQKNEDENKICNNVDSRYLKDVGVLEDRRYSVEEKKSTLCSTFNTSSLSYLKRFNPNVSYRSKSIRDEKSIINSNIMLELAENVARNACDKKLDIEKLKSSLAYIKSLVLEDYEDFFEKLKNLLLECGIVLVGLPHLKNSGLNGACKKFRNGSVLLLITDRNKKADIFWFSLAHELGHILKKDFYTSDLDMDAYDRKEAEADKFASDFLIDSKEYKKFIDKGNFTYKSILDFSKENQTLACIVTGRLKNDGLVGHEKFNNLNINYNINLR